MGKTGTLTTWREARTRRRFVRPRANLAGAMTRICAVALRLPLRQAPVRRALQILVMRRRITAMPVSCVCCISMRRWMSWVVWLIRR